MERTYGPFQEVVNCSVQFVGMFASLGKLSTGDKILENGLLPGGVDSQYPGEKLNIARAPSHNSGIIIDKICRHLP